MSLSSVETPRSGSAVDEHLEEFTIASELAATASKSLTAAATSKGHGRPASAFPSGTCGCTGYKRPTDERCVACPLFMPEAMLMPCCVVGANCSLLAEEKPLLSCCTGGSDGAPMFHRSSACQMGWRGWLCCLSSTLLGCPFFGPMVCCCFNPVMGAANLLQRRAAVAKHMDGRHPSGCLRTAAEACLCQPCTLFQHNVFLQEQRCGGSGSCPTSARGQSSGIDGNAGGSSSAAAGGGQHGASGGKQGGFMLHLNLANLAPGQQDMQRSARLDLAKDTIQPIETSRMDVESIKAFQVAAVAEGAAAHAAQQGASAMPGHVLYNDTKVFANPAYMGGRCTTTGAGGGEEAGDTLAQGGDERQAHTAEAGSPIQDESPELLQVPGFGRDNSATSLGGGPADASLLVHHSHSYSMALSDSTSIHPILDAEHAPKYSHDISGCLPGSEGMAAALRASSGSLGSSDRDDAADIGNVDGGSSYSGSGTNSARGTGATEGGGSSRGGSSGPSSPVSGSTPTLYTCRASSWASTPGRMTPPAMTARTATPPPASMARTTPRAPGTARTLWFEPSSDADAAEGVQGIEQKQQAEEEQEMPLPAMRRSPSPSLSLPVDSPPQPQVEKEDAQEGVADEAGVQGEEEAFASASSPNGSASSPESVVVIRTPPPDVRTSISFFERACRTAQ